MCGEPVALLTSTGVTLTIPFDNSDAAPVPNLCHHITNLDLSFCHYSTRSLMVSVAATLKFPLKRLSLSGNVSGVMQESVTHLDVLVQA